MKEMSNSKSADDYHILDEESQKHALGCDEYRKICASRSPDREAKLMEITRGVGMRVPAAHVNKIKTKDLSRNTRFEKNKEILLQCIYAFIIYLMIGIVAFSCVLEHWNIIDSMFVSVSVFTTIGYGNKHVPTTTYELTFMIFFILVGFVGLGGLALNTIVENGIKSYEKIIDDAKQDTSKRYLERFSSGKLSLDAKQNGDVRRDLMKAIYLAGPPFCALYLCAVVIGYVEGWSILTSTYFFIVSVTTVGFDDYVPQTKAMRLFCVFFLPIAVGFTAKLLGKISGIYLKHRARQMEIESLNIEITNEELDVMDFMQNGDMTYPDFLQFMLVRMNKVQVEECDRLWELFQELDSNNSGTLQRDELVRMASGKTVI